MLHSILRNTPLSVLIISALFSGILTVATAQTSDTSATVSASATTSAETRMNTGTTSAVRAHMDEKRKAFMERVADMRADATARTEALTARMTERRARISENAETRVRAVISGLKTRGADAVTKLGSIADRIEARANLLKGRGVNVDTALAFVAEARVELRAASVFFTEDLAVEVDTAVTDASPKEAFAQVKESMRTAREHIHAAQKALRDAVAALKDAVAATADQGVSGAVRNDQ